MRRARSRRYRKGNTNAAIDLGGLSGVQLKAKGVGLKEELFGLRFQAATGQLESSSRMRNVRKDIARIYTVLQERNLGIVDEPVVEEK